MDSLQERLRRAYGSHTFLQERFLRQEGYGPDKALRRLSDIAPITDISPAGLDALTGYAEILVPLLTQIPLEAIYKAYGESPLLWIYLHSEKIDVASLDKCITRDRDIFTHAKNIRKSLSCPLLLEETLHLADAMIAFRKEVIKPIDVSPYCSILRSANFTLENLFPWRERGRERKYGYGEHDRSFSLYLDAPMGFGLLHKEKLQAVIAFVPLDKKTIQILQLQGTQEKVYDPQDKDKILYRKSSRGLMHVDWCRLLVDVVQKHANEQGYLSLSIQSGKKNLWAGDHLSLDDAITRYDGTARRLGFTQRKDADWYRPLD